MVCGIQFPCYENWKLISHVNELAFWEEGINVVGPISPFVL